MLSEIIEFNPTRSIKKGTNAPFIEMAALNENSRDISYIFQKEFNGSGTKFKNGDTLLARITPCLENGKTAKVNCLKEGEHAHGSTEFIILKAKEPEYDEDFIYYLCRWSKFRDYAIGRMEGTSGRQRVDWKAIAEFECDLPKKEIRKEIGFFLKQIDDKIANNNQINQTLESLAHTLFKSWFVDFDPVITKIEAKKTGRDPLMATLEMISGRTANDTQNFAGAEYNELKAIAAIFPDELENSELGDIPKGWKVGKIGEIYSTTSGGTPSRENKSFYEDGSVSWVKSKELINSFVFETEESITKEAINKSSAKLLPKDSILLAMYGATVGQYSILGATATCNQAICAILPNENYPYTFIYSWLKENKENVMSRASGSAQQNISQIVIKNIELVVPPINLLKSYHQRVKNKYDYILNNQKANQTLSNLRDEILPKLLSNKTILEKGGVE